MRTRTKIRAFVVLATALVVLGATTWGGWPEWRDDELGPDDRHVTVTVTWEKIGDAPGFIQVKGNLGGPFHSDAYSPSPFVEQGITTAGDVVEVHAVAIDGPFASFDCTITTVGGLAGAGVAMQKTIWAGLRAYCRQVIA